MSDDPNAPPVDETGGGTPTPAEPPEPDEDDELLAAIEDDEEPEADPEPAVAGTPPAEPRRQRGDPARGKVESENRALKRKLDDVEAQVRQLLSTQRQPSQAEVEEQRRREDEAYELMSPSQQRAYTENKIARQVQQLVQNAVAPIHDQNDRAEYERELDRNPKLKRFTDQVEDFKRQAPGVPRRMLLATALGLQALDNQGAVRTRGARNSAAQGEQHRAAPSSGVRADVSPNRGRRGDDLDERLRGQSI
jgi:hypothetical protein